VSRDIFIEKQGLVMQLGRVCGLAAVLIEQPAHFWDESPIRKAFLSIIQAGLSCTPQISFAEKGNIIYFFLKSSIFFEVDVLPLSGRKRFQHAHA